MGTRNDDISLILAKAKKQGFLPDVKDSEVDVLTVEASTMFGDDALFAGNAVNSATVNDLIWRTGTDLANIPVVRTTGDSRPARWEYIHNGGGGYLWHLLAGANSTSGDWMFGVGLDGGSGNGFLVRNKSQGIGQKIEQTATISSATAYGLTISQSSIAPAAYLELRPEGLAPLLILSSFQTDTSIKMQQWNSATGAAGDINGYDGQLQWYKNSEWVGGTFTIRSDNGVLAPARKYIKTNATNGTTWHSPSGTDNQWWPFRVNANGSTWRFQAAGLSSTPDSATFSDIIQIKNNALGFFGTAAISKPSLTYSRTGESTAAAAIRTVLSSLGLVTDATVA